MNNYDETEGKMRNRSNRYDINITRPRQGYEYTKYKIFLSMMMVMCNKQHLSNMWDWIREKFKQHWGWIKKALLIKKACITTE